MSAIGGTSRRAAVIPATIRPVNGAEAKLGEVGGEAAGRRAGQRGGGAEGESGLGQKRQNTENSRDHPAPGMAVSRRISQFGCCQPGALHVITIAGAADTG